MMFFQSFEFVSPREPPEVCEDTYSGLDCSQRICPSCQNNGSCVEGGQVRPTMWTFVIEINCWTTLDMDLTT